MSPPYEIHTPSRTESPLLHLGEARSQGELVTVMPQSTALTVNHYEHAVALVDQMRANIRSVTDRKGPRAVPRGVDGWFVGSNDMQIGFGICGGFVAFLAGLGASLEAVNNGATKFAVIAGAIFTITSIPAFIAFTCEGRMARRQSEKLDSGDVERMLASYAKATPEDRAVLERFVRDETAGLADGLSPKATLTRDKVLSLEISSSAEDPQRERATQLALAIRALRDGANETSCQEHIGVIEDVIVRAPPDERRQVAATLQRMLFKGEHPTFSAKAAQQVKLYTAMDLAGRGEATEKAKSDGAQ